MSFTLTMSGVIVGRSELEMRDADARVARGVFRPGLGYDLVEPIFGLYEAAGSDEEALARYRKSCDALRLQLTDSSGKPIVLRELHIRRTASAIAPLLEVETDDPAFWAERPTT